MRLKISAKVFLVSFFLIAGTVLGAVVLNKLYLEKFYLYKKRSQIEEVSKIVLSKNIDEESLFELEERYGVLMDVVTLEELRLTSGKFFTTAGKEVYKELVKKGDSVEVIQYMGIKHIMFYKLLDKTRVIRIMTSIQPLEEAIGIANELYLYTGLIVMGIGFFMSLIFSKTLVKLIISILDLCKFLNLNCSISNFWRIQTENPK